MSDDELKFDEAIGLRDNNRYQESIEAFEALIREPGTQRFLVLHSHLQAGGMLRNLFMYDVAERHARRAIELAPGNELASLLLFHVLASTARMLQALEEMVRYVSRRDSKLYRDLLADGYDMSELGSRYVELVDRARTLLANRNKG
jgi:tetratricopeptide (TPR) repeat protein